MATKKYVSLEKLGLYDEKIKKVISDGDAAALTSAKSYADGLASNYEAAGSVASAKTELQGKIDTVSGKADAAQAAADKAQEEVDALELVVQNIQENAYDDSELRGLIDGLEEGKADKAQVATDIAAAVKVEEEARIAAVAGVQGAVDTLSQTHATDKAALEAAIALKADQSALEAVSAVANAAVKQSDYNAKVEALEAEDTRIAGLVSAEAERAAAAEEALDERLEKVETFFVTAEGETIDQAMDTLVEIQKYITEDGTAADEMVKDIAANAKAIEDMDAAYKAADQTLQSNIDTLSGTVATKAAQADLEALDTRVETAEGDIDALEGRMDTAEADIDALQAKFGEGEGSVADMIADAVAVETAAREAADTAIAEAAAADAASKDAVVLSEAQKYADTEIDKVEATIATLQGVVDGKAAQADLTALAGRVTTAEGEIDTLQSEMDAVEAKAAANETAIGTLNTAVAGKASQADLDAAVTRIAANEAGLAAFVEASEEDINGLFT